MEKITIIQGSCDPRIYLASYIIKGLNFKIQACQGGKGRFSFVRKDFLRAFMSRKQSAVPGAPTQAIIEYSIQAIQGRPPRFHKRNSDT